MADRACRFTSDPHHHIRGPNSRGKLIRYRVPIAEKNRVAGGPTHFERPTSSVKTAWAKVCKDAGVDGATPKTLRHTMQTWLAYQGVPKEQRVMLAGHVGTDKTSKYGHLTPDCLSGIDAYFETLSQLTKGYLKPTSGARDLVSDPA